jgi:hypothetical protein
MTLTLRRTNSVANSSRRSTFPSPFYYVVWHERLNATEIMFIPPLALLVLGSLIIWVAPGFSAGSKKGV